jgi:hypothetical protein
LDDLIGWLGSKTILVNWMPESGIEKVAVLATQNAYWNPRSLEHDLIHELLRRAWASEHRLLHCFPEYQAISRAILRYLREPTATPQRRKVALASSL